MARSTLAKLLVQSLFLAFLCPLLALAQFEYLEIKVAETPLGQVDLIVEANTLIPPFYQGRPEPSRGNQIKVVAVPYSNDNDFSLSSLIYFWKINGEPVNSTLGTKSSVLIDSTQNSVTSAELTIRTSDDKLFASAQTSVTNEKPFIVFYEDNPLRGLSSVGINDSFNLIGEEATIRAVPFFVTANEPWTKYSTKWKVNGQNITAPSPNPLALTLQKNDGDINTFNIDLALTSNSPLLDYLSNSFTFSFEL